MIGVRRLSVCLMSHTSALTRKPIGLGRRNFAQGYPRSHATHTPTSRSKVKVTGGGGILWRPPSRTACSSCYVMCLYFFVFNKLFLYYHFGDIKLFVAIMTAMITTGTSVTPSTWWSKNEAVFCFFKCTHRFFDFWHSSGAFRFEHICRLYFCKMQWRHLSSINHSKHH